MTKEKAKSLAFRFLRGGIGGAASVVVTMVGAGINANGIASLKDLQLWMATIFFASIAGFITGVFMAVDKWYRMV